MSLTLIWFVGKDIDKYYGNVNVMLKRKYPLCKGMLETKSNLFS